MENRTGVRFPSESLNNSREYRLVGVPGVFVLSENRKRDKRSAPALAGMSIPGAAKRTAQTDQSLDLMTFAATVIASIKRFVRILYSCVSDGAGAIVIISDVSFIGYRSNKRTVSGVYLMIPAQISTVVEIIMFHRLPLSYIFGAPQVLL